MDYASVKTCDCCYTPVIKFSEASNVDITVVVSIDCILCGAEHEYELSTLLSGDLPNICCKRPLFLRFIVGEEDVHFEIDCSKCFQTSRISTFDALQALDSLIESEKEPPQVSSLMC